MLVQEYLNQLSDLRRVSGTTRESVVREAFKDLLKGAAKQHDLVFVPEYEIITPARDRRYVDGALLHAVRVPFGYWEAKDEKDDLDAEIDLKFRRGYPQDNIIFEDSIHAVLIQNKAEVIRCAVDDVDAMKRLLDLFFSYERQEIAEFRKAIEQFRTDLPAVLTALRDMIEEALRDNIEFRSASDSFLRHAQEAINPRLTDADVREMLIQHILTEDIFSKVFDEDDFHRQNNIAKELYRLEGSFFTGNLKKQTLRGLDAYYAAIRSAAAQITSHHEKQAFLKVIYESFYKVYNPKAADRLGVVYTPNEIVRFMISGADWLCGKHFGKHLIDPNVQILDPATGTGTFVCELLEHFRGQKAKLKEKYHNELLANEVAILPYYVANLNIEATYAAITDEYSEFPNLCFVDTLDNGSALRKYAGHMDDLFGSVSQENVGRIRKQNARRISVIIGNPPYNANQQNENEDNKNRDYPDIDKRIKETYVSESTAQKTKVYDMYARFYRWASDRVDENGVLAFVTNRSFIDSRTFDGFRKVVANEFNEIRIVDLGGDVRENPKLSGNKHNVFGIQTGVAIAFLVKRRKQKGCRIYYTRRPEFETAEEKLAFLSMNKLEDFEFEELTPDEKYNWICLAKSDFDSMLPVVAKKTKTATKRGQEKAICKTFSFGVVTNRDEWVYGTSEADVGLRVRFLVDTYNEHLDRIRKAGPNADVSDITDGQIKWTRAVKRDLARGTRYSFDQSRIVIAAYRPYVERHLYFSPKLNEMPNLMPVYFGDDGRAANPALVFTDPTSQKPFMVWATEKCPDMHLVGAAAGAVTVPLKRDGIDGDLGDNVTDWAFETFRRHYQAGRSKPVRPITKLDVFYYVYGVLHDPLYRESYAEHLKREYPRIPLHGSFWVWADWGRELLGIHLHYSEAEPFSLRRHDLDDSIGLATPKCLMRADKREGRILIDSQTTLSGIPATAWEYKLANRSAIEWILEQYKESRPKDPTIREKFNTYKFSEHKEKVIDLLARVTTVSVQTMAIVEAMRVAER